MAEARVIIERKPRQIAKRAIVLGTLAFRASLEVTDHPRVLEISKQLLPWLHRIGCADELDPIEERELATPPGGLGNSEKIDVNWASEAAMFFCWMLNLVESLEDAALTDHRQLTTLLSLLRPEALDIVRSAQLREADDIRDNCWHSILVQSLLRERRIESPGRDILRRITLQQLTELGLVVTDEALARASETVGRMTPDEVKCAAGLYSVRAHAAKWHLCGRRTYFDCSSVDDRGQVEGTSV
jgi:hypothetical protein